VERGGRACVQICISGYQAGVIIDVSSGLLRLVRYRPLASFERVKLQPARRPNVPFELQFFKTVVKMTTRLSKFTTVAHMAAVSLAFSVSHVAASETLVVPMHKVSAEGVGQEIGKIEISADGEGISLNIDVTGIGAGPHGFHLHENGSCEPGEKDGKAVAALKAGSHFDPSGSKTHKGPRGDGHKGDLPYLTSTAAGVKAVVTVDHLSLEDVKGRSLVIHEGGDNYSDTPPFGGGGSRIACGVIPSS
jgi:Cu-Zn family superoxide dismutase